MFRLYVGDSHGNFANFNSVVESALAALGEVEVSEIVSVGDFGFWPRFGLSYSKGNFDQKVRFIDGNHEDFDALHATTLPNDYWQCEHVARGTFENGVFFMGGASSIDKARRTIGRDWFEAENISYAEFYAAAEVAETNDVNVMCCHDSIMSAYPRLIGGNKGERVSDPNAEALEQLFQIASPKVYIHGHHHVTTRYQIADTTFVSLNRCCRNSPDFKACTVAVSDVGEIVEW